MQLSHDYCTLPPCGQAPFIFCMALHNKHGDIGYWSFKLCCLPSDSRIVGDKEAEDSCLAAAAAQVPSDLNVWERASRRLPPPLPKLAAQDWDPSRRVPVADFEEHFVHCQPAAYRHANPAPPLHESINDTLTVVQLGISLDF